VAGFQLVVVGAQEVEPVEEGEMGGGPVEAVVFFEAGGGGTAGGGAGWVEPFEGALLVGGRFSSEVGDAGDFVASGEDGGDEGVGALEDVVDGGDCNRSVADEFAGFAGDREAS
jgi:hypothetical protein